MHNIYFQEIAPHPHLQRLIKHYWVFRRKYVLEEQKKQSTLPDGCIDVIFHCGATYQGVNNQQKLPRSFITGQSLTANTFEVLGDTSIVGIRFFPWGLAAFSKIPINELNQQVVDVQDVWGEKMTEIEQQIQEKPSNEAIQLIEHFLCQQLREVSADIWMVKGLLKQIYQHKGNLKIGEMIKQSGLNERSVERKFKKIAGLSPKNFARINRFNYALTLMHYHYEDYHNLTDLAYICGYFDQSHFIKEFRQIMGESPVQYLKRIGLT